jgi:mono/diheme cytochrome c family protein
VPSGIAVKPLATIAVSEGLPESYAAEWDVTSPADMASAASDPSAKNAATDTASSTTSPTLAANPEKKKTITLADIKAGQAIYTKNCVVCHTAELTGRPPLFPTLINVVARIGEAHVKKNVQKGAPPMPAFPNLSPTELDQLVAYLSNPSKAGHPAPPAN